MSIRVTRKSVEEVVRDELPLAALADAVVRASRSGDRSATKTCATEWGASGLRGEARRVLLEEEMVQVARLHKIRGITTEMISDRGGYQHVELQSRSLRVTVKWLDYPSQPLAEAGYRNRIVAVSTPLFDGHLDSEADTEELAYLVLVYAISSRDPAVPNYIALRDPSGQTQEISLAEELRSVLMPATPPPAALVEPERKEPPPQAKLRKKSAKRNA